jgi:2'-5' RNA ligase
MRVQARVTVPSELRIAIDEFRMRWDPEKATGNPAHITLAYHDEAPAPRLLAERLLQAAGSIAPFELELGVVKQFREPVRGIYLSVEDPSRGFAAIREILLQPPFTRRGQFGLHVTLLHPDQGRRLQAAWDDLSDRSFRGTFVVKELQLVGAKNETLMSVSLSQVWSATSSPS